MKNKYTESQISIIVLLGLSNYLQYKISAISTMITRLFINFSSMAYS